jgi:V/A-type H+-transporting ATPase subunit K
MNRRDPAGSGRRFRRTLAVNVVSFFGALIVGSVLTLSTAYAEGAAAADTSWYGTACLAAALATGASCVGAGIAVSAAASAALGALSENEGIMGKAMIFVALAEGVAIYGLIISIMILGKVV